MVNTKEQIIKELNIKLFGVEEPNQLTEKERLILDGAIAFFINGAVENTLPVYQLETLDNEPWALIRTDAPREEIAKWFGHYYQDYGGLNDLSEKQCEEIGFPEDLHGEGFAKLLVIKGYKATRSYVEATVNAGDAN
jgi:hypothetical protein